MGRHPGCHYREELVMIAKVLSVFIGLTAGMLAVPKVPCENSTTCVPTVTGGGPGISISGTQAPGKCTCQTGKCVKASNCTVSVTVSYSGCGTVNGGPCGSGMSTDVTLGACPGSAQVQILQWTANPCVCNGTPNGSVEITIACGGNVCAGRDC